MGIGSEVLGKLKEKYANFHLFLEIESTSEKIKMLSEEEQKIRRNRKRFYHLKENIRYKMTFQNRKIIHLIFLIYRL